jgi:hypothetical protein
VTGPTPERNARRNYVKVIVVWAIVLLALFAFQEYFG